MIQYVTSGVENEIGARLPYGLKAEQTVWSLTFNSDCTFYDTSRVTIGSGLTGTESDAAYDWAYTPIMSVYGSTALSWNGSEATAAPGTIITGGTMENANQGLGSLLVQDGSYIRMFTSATETIYGGTLVTQNALDSGTFFPGAPSVGNMSFEVWTGGSWNVLTCPVLAFQPGDTVKCTTSLTNDAGAKQPDAPGLIIIPFKTDAGEGIAFLLPNVWGNITETLYVRAGKAVSYTSLNGDTYYCAPPLITPYSSSGDPPNNVLVNYDSPGPPLTLPDYADHFYSGYLKFVKCQVGMLAVIQFTSSVYDALETVNTTKNIDENGEYNLCGFASDQKETIYWINTLSGTIQWNDEGKPKDPTWSISDVLTIQQILNPALSVYGDYAAFYAMQTEVSSQMAAWELSIMEMSTAIAVLAVQIDSLGGDSTYAINALQGWATPMMYEANTDAQLVYQQDKVCKFLFKTVSAGVKLVTPFATHVAKSILGAATSANRGVRTQPVTENVYGSLVLSATNQVIEAGVTAGTVKDPNVTDYDASHDVTTCYPFGENNKTIDDYRNNDDPNILDYTTELTAAQATQAFADMNLRSSGDIVNIPDALDDKVLVCYRPISKSFPYFQYLSKKIINGKATSVESQIWGFLQKRGIIPQHAYAVGIKHMWLDNNGTNQAHRFVTISGVAEGIVNPTSVHRNATKPWIVSNLDIMSSAGKVTLDYIWTPPSWTFNQIMPSYDNAPVATNDIATIMGVNNPEEAGMEDLVESVLSTITTKTNVHKVIDVSSMPSTVYDAITEAAVRHQGTYKLFSNNCQDYANIYTQALEAYKSGQIPEDTRVQTILAQAYLLMKNMGLATTPDDYSDTLSFSWNGDDVQDQSNWNSMRSFSQSVEYKAVIQDI